MKTLTTDELGMVAGGRALTYTEMAGGAAAIGGAVVISRIISRGVKVTISEAAALTTMGGVVAVGIVAAGVSGYLVGTAINNAYRSEIGAVVERIFPITTSGGNSEGGCVEVSSVLPNGGIAGNIKVEDSMQLADETNFEPSVGIVSYSKRKKAPGYRITTKGGVSLVCSDSAPIPTPEGLVLAPQLLGKSVAVRRDRQGESKIVWELIESIESIGEIEVQHITVGDKCFWAGENVDNYILHHNIKAVNGGSWESGWGSDW